LGCGNNIAKYGREKAEVWMLLLEKHPEVDGSAPIGIALLSIELLALLYLLLRSSLGNIQILIADAFSPICSLT